MSELEELRAVVERVRAAVIASSDGGRCGVKEHSKSSAAAAGYWRCADAVLAALDGAPEPEAVEWEQRVMISDGEEVLVRRRKAGAPLPVEGGESA
ncbi:hypothetical protein ACXR2T_10685 [Leucobacter sp. HY1910]